MRRPIFLAAFTLVMASLHADAQQPARATILYDAFGPASALQKDWGFAAFVEYGGRRILFDTGNDAAVFAHNVKQLGVDLTRLDAVVISHRHGDHTTGLEVVVAAHPGVPIYVPHEAAFFRGGAPKEFLARDPSLPPQMRHFDGRDPGVVRVCGTLSCSQDGGLCPGLRAGERVRSSARLRQLATGTNTGCRLGD